MVLTRSRMIPSTFAAFVVLTLAVGHASADEMVGKVKSVDADAKKVVITEEETKKDREVTIDASTSWTKEKKGKVSKKFDLTKLKVGSVVEVTSQGTLASRVVIKAGKKKKAKDD